MQGDDDIDDKMLHEMAEQAIRYVQSYQWCVELHEKYFGDGYGGIVAVFLFLVTIRGAQKPEWIWVIVGDIPSCYLEVDGFPSPKAALHRYIEGVEEWIATPEDERESNPELPPIEVPQGEEYVELLKSRLEALRTHILPHMRDY